MEKEKQILQSWAANAGNWIGLIDSEAIESRKLVTNQAIFEAVSAHRPGNVLDLGCGEGWLTRALNARGISTCGVDGSEALIANARAKDGGRYEVATYENIIAGVPLDREPFDGIVLNFALFTRESTEDLLAELRRRLLPGGRLFIQTLHPFNLLAGEQPYESHWKSNSWDGLPGAFTQPHEWYCRTLGDWVSLFARLDYRLLELREPLHPRSGKPVSMIMVLGR